MEKEGECEDTGERFCLLFQRFFGLPGSSST